MKYGAARGGNQGRRTLRAAGRGSSGLVRARSANRARNCRCSPAQRAWDSPLHRWPCLPVLALLLPVAMAPSCRLPRYTCSLTRARAVADTCASRLSRVASSSFGRCRLLCSCPARPSSRAWNCNNKALLPVGIATTRLCSKQNEEELRSS